MRFLCLAALAALALSACNAGYDATLPDGGRGRVNCRDSAVSVPVTVLDKAGMPQDSAGVVVTYVTYADEEVLTTDGRGVAVVKEKHGPGIVRVQAQFNDLKTDTAELTFIGGECSNAVTPRSVTLQLF